MEYKHISVMYNECMDGLAIKPDGIYLDGTFGGGGHSRGILEKLKGGKLICVDKDRDSLNNADKIFKADNVILMQSDFKDALDKVRQQYDISNLDGVLLDLGVSSYQIDTASRGFSYIQDSRLDMRMDAGQKHSAYEVVNEYSQGQLTYIIKEYGEERFAYKIARLIVNERIKTKIQNTLQLAEIIKRAIPRAAQIGGNPAKKTFQAIRIEVNGELKNLETAITNFALSLNPGGRMCVITFHSLEDRIVKNAFKELAEGCICSKKSPVCICNNKPKIRLINNKPTIATQQELLNNKRSKSAKLRIIEKI